MALKASVHSLIRTVTEVKSDFSDTVYPTGTRGTIVEAYQDPEMYYVDLAIPDDESVTGWTYDHVTLSSHQFEVLHDSVV